jgi:hypothetical protein
MATTASATRASKRPAKRAVKQPSTSKNPEVAVGEPEAGHALNRRRRAASPVDRAPSLVERVEAQRVQLMKALSIVECCKYASATLLDVDDSEYMVPAFETVHDLLNSSAEELERIATSVQRLTEPGE